LTYVSLGRAGMHGWIVAALLLFLSLAGGAARADSLDQALIAAYLNNPRLESGRAELRAIDELVPQALAAGRPRVFLDGSVDAFTADTDVSERDDRLTPGVNLSLRQPLYAGGASRPACVRRETWCAPSGPSCSPPSSRCSSTRSMPIRRPGGIGPCSTSPGPTRPA
jgi:hypothetical protein